MILEIGFLMQEICWKERSKRDELLLRYNYRNKWNQVNETISTIRTRVYDFRINIDRWQLKNNHWKDKIRELIKSNPLFSDFDDISLRISIGLIKWSKIVSCFAYYDQYRNY